MSIYDYAVTKRDGTALPLSEYKGKVLLIVNTATGCGFTPHYAPLEEMYEKYHERGLEILDIPCNQFGHQAPGSDEEIHEFCTMNYHTQFPQMKKADVNGDNALPLFKYLVAQKGYAGMPENPTSAYMAALYARMDPDYAKKADIKWNFTKFIVNRDGDVVARFEPTADMKEVEEFVASLL